MEDSAVKRVDPVQVFAEDIVSDTPEFSSICIGTRFIKGAVTHFDRSFDVNGVKLSKATDTKFDGDFDNNFTRAASSA